MRFRVYMYVKKVTFWTNRSLHGISVLIASASSEVSDESAYVQTRLSLRWSHVQSIDVF